MNIEDVIDGRAPYHVSTMDALAFLMGIPTGVADAVVTDCPFALGTREPTVGELMAYLQGAELDCGGDIVGRPWNLPTVAVWRETLRVLKPGGHLTTFAGARTFDLIGLGLRAAGFERTDGVSAEGALRWYHGTGAVLQPGKLKPGWEPILVGRRPIAASTVAAQMAATGTGQLFTEACRTEVSEAARGRAAPNASFHHHPACVEAGTRRVKAPAPASGPSRRSTSTSASRSRLGGTTALGADRRGADGTEAIPAWLCTAACCDEEQHPSGGDPPPCRRCGAAMVWQCAVAELDRQSATNASRLFPQYPATFLYCAKPPTRELHAGCEDMFWRGDARSRVGFVRVTEQEWEGLPEAGRARGNIHPTRKGVKQMRWNVRLVAPKGGLVIDPYHGSGGTGIACLHEGVRILANDREPEYVEISLARLRHHAAAMSPQAELFAGGPHG